MNQHAHILHFRHGSRGLELMGWILMLTGAALAYVAFADPEATTGITAFLTATGLCLLLLGAKLTFGLQRTRMDIAARTWQTRSGVILRKEESGSMDELDAVVLEKQERTHGAQHYDTFRVFFRKTDNTEIHADMEQDKDTARSAAKDLSARTGLPFIDESEIEEES